MSRYMLVNRVIAITGGFGTLGRAVAEACLEAGAAVVLIDHAPVPSPPAANTIQMGGVDLRMPEAAEAAFKSVIAQMGRLDGLVNVAGGFRWETVEEGSICTWDSLYQLNLRTTVVTSKAALPHLLSRSEDGGKRIVSISAAAASKAAEGMGAYAASKAGVMKFTEALSAEVKDRLVTVNAVLPSIIDTPVNRRDMPDADATRWVQPRAVADLVAFLLSDRAASITGASIPIMGRM
ncbi:MAG: SDR family NAD(P)-dependent oxidoreductase [Steroidobacteraceae bacterium]